MGTEFALTCTALCLHASCCMSVSLVISIESHRLRIQLQSRTVPKCRTNHSEDATRHCARVLHEPAKDSRESVDAPPFLRPQPLLLQSSVSSLGTTFQELLQLQVDGMHGTAPIAHGNCRDNNENGDSVPCPWITWWHPC